MSTHALEFMYSNIKNRQTNTYMYLVKKRQNIPQKGFSFHKTHI